MAKKNKTSGKNIVGCGRCGTCCVDPIIPLNDDDVRSITKHTGIPAIELTRFYSFDDMEWPDDSDDWIHLRYGRRLMVLKKLRGRCMFLEDNGCAIYKHRPRVCRIFPYDFQFTEDLSEMDVEMQSRIKGCVASGAKNPEKNKALVQNGRLLFKADQKYRKKLERWNRENPRGTVREFLDWMGLK